MFKMIPMIQDHGEQLCGRVLQQIRQAPHLGQMRKLPESYLRERLQEITTHLGNWLAPSRDSGLGERYREFGRRCFEQSIPLHEAVDVLHILKDKINEFVRNQGFAQTSLELYAEQELEQHVSRLFGGLLCQVVCGYEQALLDAARKMPAVCRLPLPRLSSGGAKTDEGGQELWA